MIIIGVLLAVLVALFVFGFVGGLAGAIVGGGREERSLLVNVGIGLVGSLLGGTLWNVIQDRGLEFTWGGFIASLSGSVLLLLIVRMIRNRRTPWGS
ncbi:MAG: GlsB/YeaQ/YmgE family stress response membrane protein [Acidimicrobiia bacterium]|nr:GlsB/YeaQ/YmgE family stress response membrane protein [Acidimicrobiia bacterium]